MLDASTIITALLVLLCTLAATDLWRQYAIRNDNHWFVQYTFAARSSDKFWKFGFRLEDLEIKNSAQKSKWDSLHATFDVIESQLALNPKTLRKNPYDFEQTRQSRIRVNEHSINSSSVYFIHCESGGPLLRIGTNDFRTDPRDMCQINTGSASDVPSPQNMFEKVPVEDGAFSLRSISNGYFVRTVPPPADNSKLPWKLVIGGPVAGSSEKFRLTEEGYLYSSLLGRILLLS